jgi:hypothetical protein
MRSHASVRYKKIFLSNGRGFLLAAHWGHTGAIKKTARHRLNSRISSSTVAYDVIRLKRNICWEVSTNGRAAPCGRIRLMTIGVLALVGTRWGLFTLRGDSDRRGWRVNGPLLDGWGVHHAMVDTRDGTFYAAANHIVYGPTVQRSDDGGKTWKRSKKIGLPERSGLTVNATWHIEPGLPQQPGTLYLGADPACFSALTMPARPGRRTAAFSSTPPVIAGSPAAAGCAAIRSSWTPATRNVCTSVSPRRARSDRMTADRPGCRSTRTSRPTTFPARIRKSGSACTSCCCTRRGRNASGSKTTAVSTAQTIVVIPGSG